ncbi:MAG: DNA mismatch repair endonuclease MutL [Desulfobacterales bacterium]|nr:DNA mismatch repair endonuclease MutL [Desulfobacterales bacterium]
MTRIHILPEILTNKIAAGEVVERPASVVKELVENALDAESDRIIIEVKKGGRSLIRVSDNGVGMSRDDALLSLERYATSKIRTDADLFSIGTLGFRGEALPSIASVSRFSLVSRDEASTAGVEILVQGGKFKKVVETGAPRGTMVTIRDLFFNTPARRKFLKTINTEMGHIADVAARAALGRPDVLFRLIHNGKTVKNWPAASDPADRVADVVGKEAANNLFPMEFSENGITATGWTASSRIARRTSSGIYFFVNGRFVRDRMAQHALFEGYAGRLMKGRFPVAILFLNLPFDQVDVNVHPTKNEVRFSRRNAVYNAIKAACFKALQGEDRPAPASGDYPLPPRDEGSGRIAETISPFDARPRRSGSCRRPSTCLSGRRRLCTI